MERRICQLRSLALLVLFAAGRVSAAMAEELGLVGPAARACGSAQTRSVWASTSVWAWVRDTVVSHR